MRVAVGIFYTFLFFDQNMKIYISISLKVLTILTIFLLFSACQEEIEPDVQIGRDGITSDDTIAELIVAVTFKDGSVDNIIDRSSCTSVKFPVKGILNDEELNFSSLNDVLMLGVQGLEIEWLFPFEVTLSDHTGITLIDEDMLEEIQNSCVEGGDDPDNECIDFSYPFTVSVFNERTEKVETQILSSDKETYNIFSSKDFVITIEYPVSLISSDGVAFDASNNDALISIMNDAAQACDEKDIIELEDQFEEDLKELLISTNWVVTVFEEGGIDKTNLFSGYTIHFNQDLTLLAVGTETLSGNWEVDLLDTSMSVSMEFDTDTEPFILLNEDWTTLGYEQAKINIESEREEGGIKRLQLSAN